jgi:hypothetical protein
MTTAPPLPEPRPDLRLLSLGAGVQSTTLALMSAEGILPRLDAAIFADTGWEPRRVYDHLGKLTAVLSAAGIPVLRVSAGNLRADALDPAHRFASIPYFTRNSDGSLGMTRRQCTHEYKLAPIGRKVRELLGASPPDYRRVPRGRVAEQWIGFSADEIGRASGSKHATAYQKIIYPLLDLGLDRKACTRWLRTRGWTEVAKSACIGCPFHGNAQWRDLRDNHPEEWTDACEFDAAIRKGAPGRDAEFDGEGFLHRSRLPLALAPIDRVTRAEWRDRQGDLLDLIADEEAENGDPDGCSPYACRSGHARAATGSEAAAHVSPRFLRAPRNAA